MLQDLQISFFAQKDIDDTLHWVKLGETIVNYENDRNEIIVISKEKFSELHFIVKIAPVEIEDIVVFYKNGDQQNFPIKESIKSEGFSRKLELHALQFLRETFHDRHEPENKKNISIPNSYDSSGTTNVTLIITEKKDAHSCVFILQILKYLTCQKRILR